MSAVERVAETLSICDGYLDSRGSLRDPQPHEPGEAGASRTFRPRQEPGTEDQTEATVHFMHPTSHKRKRRGWAPDDTDHLVYQWVKFDGLRQSEVASRLGIDQSTVSRIVMRYEKWQAHATPATDGRLSPGERQRAQRWLTYERNERIIASSLRLAADMERSIDASRSVTSRPDSQPSAERETRTEYFVIDRTQMASRFLRLAQKVGMDNLKLTEQEPLAELPPLAEEEVADQEADATAATREREAAIAASAVDVQAAMRQRVEAEVGQAVEAAVERRMKEMDRERLAIVGEEETEADGVAVAIAEVEVAVVGAAAQGESTLIDRGLLRDPEPPGEAGASGSFRPRPEPGTEAESLTIRQTNEAAVAEVQVHNVHKMHTCITPKTSASVDAVVSCERDAPEIKSLGEACIETVRRQPCEAGASRSFRPRPEPGT